MGYKKDLNWSSDKIQPLAEKLFYSKIWKNSSIISLDEHQNSLKLILDIGGVDKLIRHSNGSITLLAQRFRRWKERRYDDFTIRAIRPSGRLTEIDKIIGAIKNKTLLAAYYAYGLVNREENGFLRFRILKLQEFGERLNDGRIKLGKFIWNFPPDSGFYFWNFNSFPKSLFFYEYIYQQQLDLFL